MSLTPDPLDGAAAGLLALRLLEDFFSHQIAEGAIVAEGAAAAFRQAGREAVTDQPDAVVERIRALVDRAIGRFDGEEAARFD